MVHFRIKVAPDPGRDVIYVSDFPKGMHMSLLMDGYCNARND